MPLRAATKNSPHDARRSCARIYRDAQALLKHIQFLLGQDKLDTTARYINDEQKFGGEAVSKVTYISWYPHQRTVALKIVVSCC
jgi:integrase